jgi:hypothetical protein
MGRAGDVYLCHQTATTTSHFSAAPEEASDERLVTTRPGKYRTIA